MRTAGGGRWGARLAVLAMLSACGESPPGDPGADVQPGVLASTPLASSESIAVVRDMTVLPNGDIWVLNSVEPLFLGFAADGRLLREHGRFGGGPAEFGAPTAFVSGNIDDEAWVFDAERHLLIEVSGAEEGRREIPLPRDGSLPPTHLFGGRELIGAGLRTARLEDVVVFARNAPAMAGGMLSFWRAIWTADLVAFNPADGSVEDLLSLGEVLGSPDDAFSLTGDFPPFPFWFRLWTVCRGSEIRVYDRLSNSVRRFSSDGTPRESDPLPPVRSRPVTREDVARVGFGLGMLEDGGELDSRATAADSARVIARLSARVDADPDALASLLPRYVDLLCSSEGALWLRHFDVERGDLRGGLAWERVSPDGTVEGFTFPEGFDAFRFVGDRVWGIQRDVFDVATVASLALPAR